MYFSLSFSLILCCFQTISFLKLFVTLFFISKGVEIMIEYSKDRKAFGSPIHNYGQIQRYIGEGFAMTEAAKALTYNCARSVGPSIQNRIGSDAVKVCFFI